MAIERSTIGGSTVFSAAEHPRDCTRASIRVFRQQARVALGDVEHDRTGFEEREITFFVRGYLAERMQREMCGLLHLGERNETNVVGLAHFFERPANAHVARESPAAIGRLRKGGDGGNHELATARAAACIVASVTPMRSSPHGIGINTGCSMPAST